MTSWVFFVFGLCIGSFLNVLIDRLPKEQTIWGRSKCDNCKSTLRWFELIPVASWLIQKARCRRCHKNISVQYPLVELATGFGFMYFYLLSPQSLTVLLSYCLTFSSLLVIFVADLKYQIIPDSMLLVALLGGKIEHLGIALVVAFFFVFLWFITRKKGMGLGDVKLVFVLGLLLGFPKIAIALYAAFLTGAAVGVILILGGKARLKSKLAFGPFLIFGTAISLLYETQILRWFYPS